MQGYGKIMILGIFGFLQISFADVLDILLLALIIYCALAWVQGQTYLLPVVGDVMADSPAAEAGIQPGDTILSIDGK